MVDTDRRMLLIGHWGPEGTKPNNARVRGLVSRLQKILGPKGRYPFLSMSSRPTGPDVLYNPRAADVSHKIIDEPENVTDQTMLFLYYIGHAVSADSDGNDLRLRLTYKSTDGSAKHINLSTLLGQVRDGHFRRLVVALDCCHAGSTLSLYHDFPANSFAMMGTGKGYAFNCAFSEALVNTLERPSSKRDQRIDRQRHGFTFERLFQSARAPFVAQSTDDANLPQKFDGGLQHELLADAPVLIPKGYNELVSRRTIYGRIFTCLELLSQATCIRPAFPRFIQQRREFLIKDGPVGKERYIQASRARQYCDFLVHSGLVDETNSRLTLSDRGRKALDGRYNKVVLDAILENILLPEVTFEDLDTAIGALLEDMIPPTPAMIAERLLNQGISLDLTPSMRIALLLLPSTGRFLKSSSDALFPSEPELLN